MRDKDKKTNHSPLNFNGLSPLVSILYIANVQKGTIIYS